MVPMPLLPHHSPCSSVDTPRAPPDPGGVAGTGLALVTLVAGPEHHHRLARCGLHHPSGVRRHRGAIGEGADEQGFQMHELLQIPLDLHHRLVGVHQFSVVQRRNAQRREPALPQPSHLRGHIESLALHRLQPLVRALVQVQPQPVCLALQQQVLLEQVRRPPGIAVVAGPGVQDGQHLVDTADHGLVLALEQLHRHPVRTAGTHEDLPGLIEVRIRLVARSDLLDGKTEQVWSQPRQILAMAHEVVRSRP